MTTVQPLPVYHTSILGHDIRFNRLNVNVGLTCFMGSESYVQTKHALRNSSIEQWDHKV